METQASPLVLTKLRVPAARARLVQRERLVHRLDLDSGAALHLLCAPAGYGKTTVLVEWARALLAQNAAVAWYALDAGDDAPAVFGSYLVASLLEALENAPGLLQAAQLLRSSPEVDLQPILTAVINAVAACGRACVLILDDYHLITSPDIHSAVTFLLDHLPENGHMIIGSRADPPLPLARLRARGRLVEVRTASLRFTIHEVRAFMSDIAHLELPPEVVTRLENRTEGWVAGLQLLTLASGADPQRLIASLSGGHRYVVDYLLEEVFGGLPVETQRFLLATSILERMCAGLCEALLGVPGLPPQDSSLSAAGCQAILEHLDRSNLFVVALDDQETWYRYHPLFREFLQARLRKDHPQAIAPLQRAASTWLAENGLLREAARHAFQARDWEYAAAFVEQHSFDCIIHSDMAALHEWCAAFPEEIMQAHPQLCVLQCWPLVMRFRRENRARVEARLAQAEQAAAALADPQLADELLEHAAVVRSFLHMAPDPAADPHALLAQAQSGLGGYPTGDPGQFSGLLTAGYAHLALTDARAAAEALESARDVAYRGGLFFGVVESSFQLARLLHSQGRLRRSAETCRAAQADLAEMFARADKSSPASSTIPASPAGPEMPALGCLDIALGSVLVELDQLEEAELHVLQGLESTGQRTTPYYLLTAYTALFRLRLIQGRPDEARVFLDQLEAAWPDIGFLTGGLRAMLALRGALAGAAANALAEAAAWCQRYTPAPDGPPPGMGPFGAAEAFYLAGLAWRRAQTALGNPQAARAGLEQHIQAAEAGGLLTRAIELWLVEAEAAEAQGDHLRARAAVERALPLAQPEGHLRVFDQSPILLRLLGEIARGKPACPAREYAARVLAAVTAPPRGAPLPGLGVPGAKPPDRVEPPVRSEPPARSELPVRFEPPDRSDPQTLAEELSPRELEVLALIARGASNQEIADALFISVGTVKSHINHILGKLCAQNRTEAVARARELGIIFS